MHLMREFAGGAVLAGRGIDANFGNYANLCARVPFRGFERERWGRLQGWEWTGWTAWTAGARAGEVSRLTGLVVVGSA